LNELKKRLGTGKGRWNEELLEALWVLAPVGYCDDLMKPTKWRCSRPHEHMWNA